MASLRGLLRELRHTPDRLWHPRRRDRARHGLETLAPSGGVLFVCYGNICRSPYAERRLRLHAWRGEVPDRPIASAGFYGPDRGSPPELCELAAHRGVDLSGHRSQLVTPALVRDHRLIVVMEPRQAGQLPSLDSASALVLSLGDLDPGPIETRAIPDPWGQPREAYSRVLDRLDRTVDALARLLSAL